MDIARFIRASFYRVILCRPLTQVYDRFSTKRAGNKALGDRGELAAERFLLRRGHVIVDRGYEARGGEVDLIAVDGRAVVFIEVKTRVSDAKGHPAEAVTFEKEAQLDRVSVSLRYHRGFVARPRPAAANRAH
jgi:putative endonuclease